MVIVYEVGDLESEIEFCGLRNSELTNKELTYIIESGEQLVLELSDIQCPPSTLQLLDKLNTREVTRVILVNLESGEEDSSLGRLTSLTFTEKAAGNSYVVQQETVLYYSNFLGYLQQDEVDMASDLALSKIVLTKTLFEVRVESCRDLLVELASPLTDMTVETLASQSVAQIIPELLAVDGGGSLPAACLEGLTFKVVTDARVLPFLKVQDG